MQPFSGGRRLAALLCLLVVLLGGLAALAAGAAHLPRAARTVGFSLAGLAIAGLCGAFWLLFYRRAAARQRLSGVFFVLAVMDGLLLALLLPVTAAPQEAAALRAAYVWAGQLLGQPTVDDAGRLLVRSCDTALGLPAQPLSVQSWQQCADGWNWLAEDAALTPLPDADDLQEAQAADGAGERAAPKSEKADSSVGDLSPVNLPPTESAGTQQAASGMPNAAEPGSTAARAAANRQSQTAGKTEAAADTPPAGRTAANNAASAGDSLQHAAGAAHTKADDGKSEPLPADAEKPAAGPFYLYLPAIAGLALARVLGLGWLPAVFLARLLGLLSFAALTARAIRIAPTARPILFAAGLMPTVGALSVTVNALRPVLALALLFFARVLALAQRPQRLPAGQWLLLGVGALALLAAGPVCWPVLALVLLLPPRRWQRLLGGGRPGVVRAALLARRLTGILAAAALCTAAVLAGRACGWLTFSLPAGFWTPTGNLARTAGAAAEFSPAAWLPNADLGQLCPMLPVWCLLLATATLCTVQTLRPSLGQRTVCLLAAALAGLTAFAAQLPAAWLLPVLPAALWALTPTALVRRREDVSALVFWCAAAAFGHALLLFCQTVF